MDDLRAQVEQLSPGARGRLLGRLHDRRAEPDGADPGRKLVAYVVPRPGQAPTAGALREHLQARLPGFMVPSEFVLLDALPRTPNGKVDVRALPDSAVEWPDLDVPFAEPSTPTERVLAAVWTSVLGVERIGIHDNFFEIGGDSILSIQIVARARQAGLRIAANDLFRHQTIADLARHVGNADGAADGPGASDSGGSTDVDGAEDTYGVIRADSAAGVDGSEAEASENVDSADMEDVFALTPMQQSLLFHSLRAGGRDPGFLQLRWTLRQSLNIPAFTRAWDVVVARHPALRTSIHWDGPGASRQIVHRSVFAVIDVEDWRDESNPDARLHAYLEADRQRGIDLTHAPAMRLALLQTGRNEWHFVWTCHHVLLDGWSGAQVLREVTAVYEAVLAGKDAGLPAARPFRAFVDWVSEKSSDQEFWTRELAGMDGPTPLPFAGADREALSPRWEEHLVVLDRKATANLQLLVRREGMTTNAVLQGCWALLLGAQADRDDVCFGSTVSGRSADLEGVDSMVGLFINTLPIRVHIQPNQSTADFLRHVQDRLTAVMDHEFTPPESVHRWSGLPAHARLYDSLIVFENHLGAAGGATAAGGLRFQDFHGAITSNFPITLVIVPGETISVNLIYDANRFDSRHMVEVGQSYVTLLDRVGREPGRRVVDVMQKKAPIGDARPSIRPRQASHAEIAPRNALELQLAHIWEEILQTGPIGVQDDFFDLGGHSIPAARLFERIEREFGRRLPISTLLQLSTIEQLARALREEGWKPSWSSLVPIKASGEKPPFFCLHSWAGNILFYRNLTRHLASDQPVYGLQAAGLDGSSPPHDEIGAMADHHLGEIRSVQPHGPYALVGICFGNPIVLEMACRLVAAGEEVAALVILDSGLPHVSSGPEPLEYRAQRVAEHWREARFADALEAYAMRKVRRGQKLFRKLRIASQREIKARWGTPGEKDELRFRRSFEHAWFSYVPSVYPGRITLIRSEKLASKPNFDWQIPRWEKQAQGGVDVFTVPGGHHSIFREPYCRGLAECIQARLDEGFERTLAQKG